MRRLSSWALPIVLGLVGVALIIVGSLPRDSGGRLPTPLATTATTAAQASPTPGATAPTPSAPSETVGVVPSHSASPVPTPSPLPDDVVAARIAIPSVAIDVAVRQSTSQQTDGFPPDDAAYILSAGNQPGRNTNSYIFAHALNSLFKPLWNVQVGAEVTVTMSDGSALRYVVTEVRPNVACPDPNATVNNPEDFPYPRPLALQVHTTCDEGIFWTAPTDHERLTLQTSQGYNRNWGELVVIADPVS